MTGGDVPPTWGHAEPPQGGQPPPHPYGYGFASPPKQSQATTAMVLGIVGLVGVPLGLMCFFPAVLLVVSPVAWVLGSTSVSAIDASGGALSGRGEAMAGMIMGIIGSVALVVALVGVAVMATLIAGSFASFDAM